MPAPVPHPLTVPKTRAAIGPHRLRRLMGPALCLVRERTPPATGGTITTAAADARRTGRPAASHPRRGRGIISGTDRATARRGETINVGGLMRLVRLSLACLLAVSVSACDTQAPPTPEEQIVGRWK